MKKNIVNLIITVFTGCCWMLAAVYLAVNQKPGYNATVSLFDLFIYVLLAIGYAIALFGSGVLMTKWLDRNGFLKGYLLGWISVIPGFGVLGYQSMVADLPSDQTFLVVCVAGYITLYAIGMFVVSASKISFIPEKRVERQ